MIKLKLLILCAILLGPSAFAYAKARRPVGSTLPLVICGQSLLLIGLGYFLPQSVCVGVLALVSALAWAAALVRIRRLKEFLTAVALPGLLLFLSSVILHDACASRLFLSYDEYSHWGILIKTIALYDELPRAGAGAPYIQFTYPPATAMLPSMVSCLLGYREGMAYLGYALLLACLLWGLASRAGRRTGAAAASMVLLYACMMAVFPMSILRLFIEPAAALLMALLMLGAYDGEEESIIETCLLAAMLAMVKNTGPVFLLIALAVRLCAKPDRREAKRCAAALITGLIAYASYSVYCRVQGIEAVISPSRLGENLRAMIGGTLHASYRDLPARFLRFIFLEPLPQSGVYASYGFGTCAAVLGVMLLLCAAHVVIARDRKKALRLWGGVWLLNLLYLGMILASYFVGFDESEVLRLAEADRYTTLVALWTGLLACALLMAERDTPHPKRRLALIGAAFAVLIPLSHPEMTIKTLITREYVQNTVWARDMTARTAAFIRSGLQGEPEAKLLCMGDYEYIELHYALAGDTDIGTPEQSWEKAPWSGDGEAVLAALETGGYTHVYVGGAQNELPKLTIDDRYAALTADGQMLKAYSLYRAEQGSDGKVRLRCLSSMPDQEQ